MYSVFHEFVGTAEEFGRNEDDRSGAITNFFVLLMGKVDEYLACRMLDVKQTENCGAIICYCDILDDISRGTAETVQAGLHQYRPPSSCQGLTAQTSS